jgi:hypothetical protein
VRFFGGWDFTAQDLDSRTPALLGYRKGVPMGGDLATRPGDAAPSFMVYALRDPIGANLDRIQIVKGWLDGDGKTHERVYDVVWAGDRKPGRNGKLPAIGSTVNAERANYTNTIGSPELGTVWTDPDFDPSQKAFYYARVLEIPTPRWSTYDAFRFGVPIPEGAPAAIQERAFTAPIWYAPQRWPADARRRASPRPTPPRRVRRDSRSGGSPRTGSARASSGAARGGRR